MKKSDLSLKSELTPEDRLILKLNFGSVAVRKVTTSRLDRHVVPGRRMKQRMLSGRTRA